MKRMSKVSLWWRVSAVVAGLVLFLSVAFSFRPAQGGGSSALPSHDQVKTALQAIVAGGGNGGSGFHMWAALVDRDGTLRVMAFSGPDRGAQFPGSRVVAAVKANSANSFSTPQLSLSSGNIYALVQPGGNAFGLAATNPVNSSIAYQGPVWRFGTRRDPALGKRVGGFTAIAGGLTLYDANGNAVGGLGLSGETSTCADHIIAWKLRDALGLDNIPGGVNPLNGTDNLIFDITNGVSASGFGTVPCDPAGTQLVVDLPTNFPVGP